MAFLDSLLSGIKTIQQGAVGLIQRATLSFTGSGVTVADDPVGLRTVVTISTGSGLGGGQTNLTLGNGSNENVNPSGQAVLRIAGPTAAFSIGGFIAPAQTAILVVINTSTAPMTFVHEDAGSTASNRLDLQSSGANLALLALKRAVTFIYDTSSSRWVLQNAGLERPILLTPTYFGADATGAVAADSAFTNMFAAKDALGGAEIHLGQTSTYALTTQVDMGTAAFRMRGSGWGSHNPQAFGTPPSISGTVIKCTAAGGLKLSTIGFAGCHISGFAIQGPGSGSTVGLQLISGVSGQAAGTQTVIDHVLVTQFYTGVDIANYEDCRYENLSVFGCITGINCRGGTTDQNFYAINVQLCGQGASGAGIIIGSTTGIHFWGGLVQSNVNYGCIVRPENNSAGSQSTIISFDGLWVENNPTAAFLLDTTSNYIDNISWTHCNDTSTPPISFIGANAIYHLGLGDGNHFIQPIALPSTVISGGMSPRMALNSDAINAITLPSQAANNSTFRIPLTIDATSNFALPSNTAAFTLAAQTAPYASSIQDVLVDVVATCSTTPYAASWRGKRATYYVDGTGTMSAVGAEIGILSPDVSISGQGSSFQIQAQKAGDSKHLQVLVYAGHAPVITDWKIRIQHLIDQ